MTNVIKHYGVVVNKPAPPPTNDPLLRHEALDRSSTVLLMITELLIEHPAIDEDPVLKQLADDLSDAAYNLYQACGARK